MNAYRVYAIVLRHLRLLTHDMNRVISIFYWPLLGILVWGFFATWMQRGQSNAGIREAILMGAVLWQMLDRPCGQIGYAMLEEMWSGNVVNLFASPASLREWMAAVVVLVALLTAFFALYYVLLVWLLYGISPLRALWFIVVFGSALFFSSIWLGFLGLALITYLGRGSQEILFVVRRVFSPFCAAFYAVDILPVWAQKIAYCLPMTYAFESMRSMILYGKSPWFGLTTSFILGITYAATGLLIFSYAFRKTKEKGLARLTH